MRPGIEELLRETLTTMRHARVFISTREKMHPTGIDLYDQLLSKIDSALKPNHLPDLPQTAPRTPAVQERLAPPGSPERTAELQYEAGMYESLYLVWKERAERAEAQVERWKALADDVPALVPDGSPIHPDPVLRDYFTALKAWIEQRDALKHSSTEYQPEPAGFCPCCNGIATKYPDGRRTCVRCEWEEAATTNSPQVLQPEDRK